MNRSGHGARNAVIGFFLIAVVVLGGMAWATVATIRLERSEAQRRRVDAIRTALWNLDSYVTPILSVESTRPHGDYQPEVRPGPAWHVSGVKLRDGSVMLPSPLLGRPWNEQIELYFQVNPHGVWSSPQLPDETVVCSADDDHALTSSQLEDARQTLAWLSSSHDIIELDRKIAWTKQLLDRGARGDEGDGALASSAASCGCCPGCSGKCTNHSDQCRAYQERRLSREYAQKINLPDPSCPLTDAAVQAIAQQPGGIPAILPESAVDGEEQFTTAVASDDDGAIVSSEPEFITLPDEPETKSVEVTRMDAIWLAPRAGGDRSLAFVRIAHEDGRKYHEGFVVDWAGMKAGLLEKIAVSFPDADLVPVEPPVSQPLDDLLETTMQTLPARLVVPVPVRSSLATAWREVRASMFAGWSAAIIVLIVAGVAMRNLVTLSNRRMQFAYAVTHELRTPLTTFRLYSDMLSAGLVPAESKQKYLDTLNHESQRLSSLVENVLEYARLENRAVRLNPTATDVKSLTETLSRAVAERCEATGVKGVTQNGVVPDQPLQTDVDIIGRIVGVLVSNACRHARQGDDPNVVLGVGYAQNKLAFDVIDSGPGVDHKDARAIFRAFRRGRNADLSAQGGIGLGLALARSWAELLGGKLELVDPRHPTHGGAHFRLTVPGRIER